MTVTDHLRRAVTTHPFDAVEVGFLALVVVGSVAFVGLLRLSAPVDLLWAAVVVTLLGATQLPLVQVVHGLVDLRRLAAAEGWPSAGSVLRGLWRSGELVLAVTVLALLASSTLVGESLATAEPTNVEGQGAITMAFVFGLALTAIAEVALVLRSSSDSRSLPSRRWRSSSPWRRGSRERPSPRAWTTGLRTGDGRQQTGRTGTPSYSVPHRHVRDDMSVTDRLRRTATRRPFAAAEVGLLAVVVVATVAFAALLVVSAPVVLLWAAVLALLAAATLLVLALVAHGLLDAWRLLTSDEGVTSDAVLWGLWRTVEVVIAAAFLLLAVSSTGVGAELASADPANPEAAGTIGMALAFLLFLTLALEVALFGAVTVRLGLTGE